MKKCFTKEGIKKLKKELDDLEKKERNKVAEKLKYAASFGDLSENSDYEEAKNEQNMLEMRISRLRETIKEATIVEKNSKSEFVQIGSKIVVKSVNNTEEFEIVSSSESNPLQGKISCDSPMGKAFLNKKKNDTCLINTPSGEKEYKIIEII